MATPPPASSSAALPREEPMEAPIFYPTAAEWNESPLAYLERVVRPYGEVAGIVKIVPPSNWRPAYCVDSTKFTFPTRQQFVNQLECRSRLRNLFDLALRKFRFKSGKPMERGQSHKSNWYLLFTLVLKHNNEWNAVHQELNQQYAKEVVGDSLFDKGAAQLQWIYEHNLQAFHQFLLLQQHDDEPSTAHVMQLLPKPPHTPLQEINFSTSRNRAGDGTLLGKRGEEAGYRGALIGQEALLAASNLQTPDAKTHPRPSLVDLGPAHQLELTMDMFSTLPAKPNPGSTFHKYFTDEQATYVGTVIACSQRKLDSWKVRYTSANQKPFDTEEDGSDLSLAICCGASAEEAKYAATVGVCQVCNRAHLPNTFLVCDGCEYRFHEHCLPVVAGSNNNNEFSPELDWFCPLCLDHVKPSAGDDEENEEEHLRSLRTAMGQTTLSLVAKAIGVKDLADFGFPDGDTFVLDEYIAQDAQFRRDYFNPDAFTSDAATEREFWRIAEGRVGSKQVHVQYGNDIDTGALGSGFPTKQRADKWQALKRLNLAQRQEYDSYAASPWNLNNLPTSEGSLLQLVDGNISGVIVPWLYMGMTFSAFCFHVEDHNFASINYHHKGAPKSWWGCSASQADQFERAATEMASELVEGRPDLLQGIVTMFSPSELCKRGVSMYHLIQKPGEFVVTFPRAYHGGFNHGWNSAEAVNFAGRGWLTYGDQSVNRYALLHKMPVVAHESLMVSIAMWTLQSNTVESFKTAHKLLRPFIHLIKQEEERRRQVEHAFRKKFGAELMWRTAASSVEEDDDIPNNKRVHLASDSSSLRASMSRLDMLARAFKGIPQCRTCKRYCSLSHGLCGANTFCLEHSDPTALDFSFVSIVSPAVLRDLLDGLCTQKCLQMEQWMERATRLCRGALQPDDALGEELAGGPPFAFSLANVRAFRVSAEVDYTLNRVKEWKCKPTMEACRKLLGMPVAIYLEESNVLKRALEVSEAFCARWRTATYHVADLAELERTCQAIAALPVQIPSSVADPLMQNLQVAKDWQLRARQALASPSSEQTLLGDLHREHAAQGRVQMPEVQELESRLASSTWVDQATAFLQRPGTVAEFCGLLANSNTQDVPHQVRQDLGKMWKESIDQAKQIRDFCSEGPHTVQEYSALLDSFGPEDKVLKQPEHLQLYEQQEERVKWREHARRFVLLQTKGLHYLLAQIQRAHELQISPKDDMLAAMLEVKCRLDASKLEMDSAFQLQHDNDTLDSYMLKLNSEDAKCSVCRLHDAPLSATCTVCYKQFHAGICGAVAEDDAICLLCDKDQLRFCYCRTNNTEDEAMTQCEECFGWFHSKCAGFHSHAEMERCAEFHCLQCSEKLDKPYQGKLLVLGNNQSKPFPTCGALKDCGTLCVGTNDFTCAQCGKTQHIVCAGLGADCKFCAECCLQLDLPIVPQRGVGFAAKRTEFESKLARFARPEFELVDSIRARAQQEFPGLFVEAEQLVFAPTRQWIHDLEFKRECGCGGAGLKRFKDSIGDCELWALIDEYFALPLAPSVQYLNDIFAELLFREAGRKQEKDVLLTQSDNEIFRTVKEQRALHRCYYGK